MAAAVVRTMFAQIQQQQPQGCAHVKLGSG
jgi:hypothetical protein